MTLAMPREITLVQRIIPLVAAIVVVVMTVELIRRRKLREEYAMLWMFASLVLLVFAVVPKLLWWISRAVGVYYLTVMIILMFTFLSLVVLHLAMAISRSTDDTRRLAQRLALLERELKQRQREQAGSEDEPSGEEAAGDDARESS